MQITRRDALATTAAAITTAAITAPLAIKAAGVQAALAGEPVNTALQRAHGEWERARQAFLSTLDDLEVVERKAWDTAKERGFKFGTRAYECLMRELGVDAAFERQVRDCHGDWAAYIRLIDTPADSVQDMALKCRVALIQEDDTTETELVKALIVDLERLSGEAST